jgi:hypothetical protein
LHFNFNNLLINPRRAEKKTVSSNLVGQSARRIAERQDKFSRLPVSLFRLNHYIFSPMFKRNFRKFQCSLERLFYQLRRFSGKSLKIQCSSLFGKQIIPSLLFIEGCRAGAIHLKLGGGGKTQRVLILFVCQSYLPWV